MNFNQLRFATALASTESFTLAAKECCVTQPTLSNGITQLEDELGERLFVRTTRKVTLSTFGTHILPYIVDVLNAQSAIIFQTKTFLFPDKQLIRIGTSPLVSANLFGLIIEPFRLQYPDVDIVLREMNMKDLYRMLDEGLLDFVFGVANINKGSMNTAFLYDEPLMFIPRGGVWPNPQHTLSVQLKDIADETYVMVPDACGLSRTTRTLFQSNRRKLHEYSGEAMSYQVLEEWASLGIGAAILPKSKITSSKNTLFRITDKSNKEVIIRFEASWLRTNTNATHLLEFSNHLRNVVPSIISGLNHNAIN